MGEANRWQDAFATALREQAILIAGLMKQMQKLEKQLNENTKATENQQEIIHGITGAKYVPLVYPGPSDVPRETYPRSEEQQRHDEALQSSGTGGSLLA